MEIQWKMGKYTIHSMHICMDHPVVLFNYSKFATFRNVKISGCILWPGDPNPGVQKGLIRVYKGLWSLETGTPLPRSPYAAGTLISCHRGNSGNKGLYGLE